MEVHTWSGLWGRLSEFMCCFSNLAAVIHISGAVLFQRSCAHSPCDGKSSASYPTIILASFFNLLQQVQSSFVNYVQGVKTLGVEMNK